MRGRITMPEGETQAKFKIPEPGIHDLMICKTIDKTTKNGDPMVSIGMTVMAGKDAGAWVWDNIIFPDPGSPAERIAGRSKHFLHCLGQPYEGEIEYDSDRWLDKTVRAEISIERPNGYHRDDKPIIKDYILKTTPANPTGEQAQADRSVPPPDDGDDLPF